MLQLRPYAPVLAAAVFCFLLATFGIWQRPLFPVDETRYVTVAWEMFMRNNWLLPTLNFEAYHHKPPLLFWLIMSLWGLFGVSQGAAMTAPYVIAFSLACAFFRFVKCLQPGNDRLPLLATLLLLGSLPFVMYSHLIMFDMLLGVFAVLGLTAVWQFGKTGSWRYILLFGFAAGLGVLSKGPVILLHLLWPVVLAKVWLGPEFNWRKWVPAFITGILIGAAIALSWAIPAAMRGGPEFSEKIFWGQTAGRVANSFDHKLPAWWYLPFLPLLALPWLTHAALWKGMGPLLKDKSQDSRQPLLFLGCWVVPAFLSFCLISGKQVHYLLPLVPGLLLVMAMAIDLARERTRFIHVLPVLVCCGLLALLPALLKWGSGLLTWVEGVHLPDVLQKFSTPVSLVCMGLILLVSVFARKRSLQVQIAAVVTAMAIFISGFQIQARLSFYDNYDLTQMGNIIQRMPDVPMAFVRNYHGEWGFMARRKDRPVQQIDYDHLKHWFKENPNGVAFIRTKRAEEFAMYDVIFSMPYKMTNTFAIIAPKGKGEALKRISSQE